MRAVQRWYSPLLQRSIGTTSFVQQAYPGCVFRLDKREINKGKMIRQIRFELDGQTIVQARAEVDLDHSSPAVSKLLKETNTPIGEIVRSYKVRRTRLRSTTRTREFHFVGDLRAKVWERFYVPKKKSPLV
jgi:hypothetical protein